MEERTNSETFFSAAQARNLALKKQEELKNRQYFIKAFKHLKFVENVIINSATSGKYYANIPSKAFNFENESDFTIFNEIFIKNMNANGYKAIIQKSDTENEIYYRISW